MPGDSRVERTLANLTELIDRPTGWSPSDAHAWQAVAADAKRVIESLDELGPDTAIEQGISRLAMISFLRGDAGPWGGTAAVGSDRGDTVRYRGHAIARRATLDWLEVTVVHVGYDGKTAQTVLRTQDWEDDYADDWALGALSNLDQLLDAVLAVQPLRLTGNQRIRGGELRTNAIRSSATEFDARVSPASFDRWLLRHDRDQQTAAIDRALDAAKQVADAHATHPSANTAVWDVIDRIQKLRPVDAPTEQDRAEAEADDEREGKAQQRAAEWVAEGLEQNDGE